MAKSKQDEKTPEDQANTPDEGAKQETPAADPVSETEVAVQEVLKSAKEQVELFKMELGEAIAEAKKELTEAYEALPKGGDLQAGATLVSTDPVEALAEKIFIRMCINQRQGFLPEHHVKLAFQYAQSFIDHQ